MTPPPVNLIDDIFQILTPAIALVTAFEINARVFTHDWLRIINGVNLIWLPAFVKIIAILAFGWRGAVGLGLGLLYIMDKSRSIEFVLLDVATWAILPIIAVQMGLRWFKIPTTLGGIRHWHILGIAVIEGILYAIAQTGLYKLQIPNTQIMITVAGLFIGEVSGTFIAVYTGSLVLRAKQYYQNFD